MEEVATEKEMTKEENKKIENFDEGIEQSIDADGKKRETMERVSLRSNPAYLSRAVLRKKEVHPTHTHWCRTESPCRPIYSPPLLYLP